MFRVFRQNGHHLRLGRATGRLARFELTGSEQSVLDAFEGMASSKHDLARLRAEGIFYRNENIRHRCQDGRSCIR